MLFVVVIILDVDIMHQFLANIEKQEKKLTGPGYDRYWTAVAHLNTVCNGFQYSKQEMKLFMTWHTNIAALQQYFHSKVLCRHCLLLSLTWALSFISVDFFVQII